ncbi:MAG: 16S rRNA (guanine(966)-N(2))-methyltransferase RsmD [Gammaproteobacteria bacterium]|nr:16S rRNA (guanine(966)-N(2))-methyltransferase RsmD [Gammaproteobacteria bacterium]
MTASKALGQVRIIGGSWRGRKLRFPQNLLRPTHDRVRETVFNWLAPHILGASCLDLFAGSGAFGFESLSRGAAKVTLVDSSKDIILALKKSADLLSAKNCEIAHGSCPNNIPPLVQAPFDIVFLDPPYQEGLIIPAANCLSEQHYIKSNAWVYIEAERSLSLEGLPKNWQQHRHKHTATLDYYLYRVS